jgi:hypothetical protein
VTSLTGTNLIIGALGQCMLPGQSAGSVVWGNSAVEETDQFQARGTNDGYLYSLAYLEDSVLTSASISTTVSYTGGGGSNNERLIFAVNVAAAAAPPLVQSVNTMRAAAVRASTW